MNSGRSSQEIALSQDFKPGHFTVDLCSFCCIPVGDGWIKGAKSPRRWYKGAFGKGTVIFACEAIARSLTAYADKNTVDPLVAAMVGQYRLLDQVSDGDKTLTLVNQLYGDKSLHVRAARPCPSRGSDCHNPFHRLLRPRHTNMEQQYRRYRSAVEKTNSGILQDPAAAIHLQMSRPVYDSVRNRYTEELARAKELHGDDYDILF